MSKRLQITIPDQQNNQKTNKKNILQDIRNQEYTNQNIINHFFVQQSISDRQPQFKQKSRYKCTQTIPFEQFTIQKKIGLKKPQIKKYNKFQIEVPEVNFDHVNQNRNIEDVPIDMIFKQPPAPSKGSKGKFFAFPNQSAKLKEDQIQKFNKIQSELAEVKKKYDLQLRIKDSQIQLLHKIIRQYLDRKQSCNYDELKQILKEKDIKNNDLVKKIKQISQLLKNKTQQLTNYKNQNQRLQRQIQNLNYELYIYKKHDQNIKLTRKFEEIKQEQQQKKNWQGKQHSYTKSKNSIRDIEDLSKKIQYCEGNKKQLRNKLKNKSMTTSYNKDEKSKQKFVIQLKQKLNMYKNMDRSHNSNNSKNYLHKQKYLIQ